MKQTLKLFVGVAAALGVAVFAYAAVGPEIPARPSAYVNDYAGMLSASSTAQLEARLVANEKATTNEIAVVTIPSLNGDYVENVAVEWFEKWGIGKKGKDNGVLLLIAKDDRKVKIEVGYGLEPLLVDARADAIIRTDITPAFQAGNYDAGVAAAVDSIIRVTGGDTAAVDEVVAATQNASAPKSWSFLAVPFFILIAILAVVPGVWLGGLIGFVVGGIAGFFLAGTFGAIGGALFGCLAGVILDFLAPALLVGLFRGGGGGFGGGGGSGGFGGFGGGRSGGGGASGSW